jgi:signal transduction histidine kinase
MLTKRVSSIRFRILVVLLVMVTAIVSIITISMANVFHEDKKAYIHDLSSIAALSTAEECRALLTGYAERLTTLGRMIREPDLPRSAVDRLLRVLFQDFSDLVGIIIYENGSEFASLFDRKALEAIKIEREALLERLKQDESAVTLPPPGEVSVANSTVFPSLPTLSMSVSQKEGDREYVLVAIIHLDGLQRLSSRAGVFDAFLVDSRGNLLAHPDGTLLHQKTFFPLPEEATRLREGLSAAFIHELEVNGHAMIDGYAAVELGGVVAGVRIPKSAAFLASREVLNRLLWVAFGLLVLAALTSVLGSRRLTRPLERLAAATREVAKGRFDIQVKVDTRDEIGSLASSFNQMAAELQGRETALQAAQAQLIQSEKMAAFGQLGAGVAHEVKNPLAGILGCVQLSLRKVDAGTNLERNLKLIEKETKRCKSIVENLLKFARQEKAIMDPIDLGSVVDDSIAIVNHQMELNSVSIQKEAAEALPRIQGNANQLQQVLVNLLMNAQQAMGASGGTIRVSARRAVDNLVELRVADTGPGIPLDIQQKIFEPFFTTKPGGKGTGLGLSVSYGIVKDHGGTIRVESTPGDGATFVLSFPVLEPASADAKAPPLPQETAIA